MPQLAILHDEHLVEIKCHAHGWHNIPAKRWNFNGNLECPTFSPSVRELAGTPGEQVTRCHFTVTNGKITYHDDNHHEFKGQTLDLLPFTEAEIAEKNWVTRQEESEPT